MWKSQFIWFFEGLLEGLLAIWNLNHKCKIKKMFKKVKYFQISIFEVLYCVKVEKLLYWLKKRMAEKQIILCLIYSS